MQCYQHQDRAAVGVCKACQKAVCLGYLGKLLIYVAR